MNQISLYSQQEIDSTSIITVDREEVNDSSSSPIYFISDIKIFGNEKTLPETIFREMSIKKGMTVNEEMIRYDEDRILSLGLFTQVKLMLLPSVESYELLVLIQEAWYIWPFPIFEIKDHDWNKLSYGLGLTVRNITGRNETLFTAGTLGFDPFLAVNYFHPWIANDLHLKLNTQLTYENRRNRSLRSIVDGKNYDEKILRAELSIGKRFGLFHDLFLLLQYKYLQVPEYFAGRTVSTTGIDRHLSLGIKYNYDSRDFSGYPKQGSYFGLTYLKQGLGESEVNYHLLWYDFRKFWSFGDFILSVRNSYRTIFGNSIPNYANSFIGYEERIRGHYYDYYEGESSQIGSIELRVPFIKNEIIELDVPLIPRELLTLNILVDIHLFADGGVVWNRNQKSIDQKIEKGFGIGMSFIILPYRSIRFDLGFNEKLDTQFIIDLGMVF